MPYSSGTLGKAHDKKLDAAAHSTDKDARPTAAQRGYGSKWRTARATYLASHPLCKDHEQRGHIVAATIVDHIVPHRGDLALFWSRSNWQPLCKPCHDSHKQRLESGTPTPGCNTQGLPTDPAHHWHRKG